MIAVSKAMPAVSMTGAQTADRCPAKSSAYDMDDMAECDQSSDDSEDEGACEQVKDTKTDAKKVSLRESARQSAVGSADKQQRLSSVKSAAAVLTRPKKGSERKMGGLSLPDVVKELLKEPDVLRWIGADSMFEVLNGEKFESRFNELRRVRNKVKTAGMERPFSRMHNFFSLEVGDKWARTGTMFRPTSPKGFPTPELLRQVAAIEAKIQQTANDMARQAKMYAMSAASPYYNNKGTGRSAPTTTAAAKPLYTAPRHPLASPAMHGHCDRYSDLAPSAPADYHAALYAGGQYPTRPLGALLGKRPPPPTSVEHLFVDDCSDNEGFIPSHLIDEVARRLLHKGPRHEFDPPPRSPAYRAGAPYLHRHAGAPAVEDPYAGEYDYSAAGAGRYALPPAEGRYFRTPPSAYGAWGSEHSFGREGAAEAYARDSILRRDPYLHHVLSGGAASAAQSPSSDGASRWNYASAAGRSAAAAGGDADYPETPHRTLHEEAAGKDEDWADGDAAPGECAALRTPYLGITLKGLRDHAAAAMAAAGKASSAFGHARGGGGRLVGDEAGDAVEISSEGGSCQPSPEGALSLCGVFDGSPLDLGDPALDVSHHHAHGASHSMASAAACCGGSSSAAAAAELTLSVGIPAVDGLLDLLSSPPATPLRPPSSLSLALAPPSPAGTAGSGGAFASPLMPARRRSPVGAAGRGGGEDGLEGLDCGDDGWRTPPPSSHDDWWSP